MCHWNLAFAEMIGPAIHEHIAQGVPHISALVGEWVFSEALWGSDAHRDAAYLDGVRGPLHVPRPQWRDDGLPRQVFAHILQSAGA